MSLGKPELFIDGVWQLPALGGTLPVVCPASEEVVGHVGAATAADVDLAVAAATRAFKSWRRTSGAERAALLRKVAAGVRVRKAELAVLEATDNGKPLDEAEWDMDDVAVCFDFFADKAEALDGGGDTAEVALPDDRFACAVKKEPLGVCALVTPWNYPLLSACARSRQLRCCWRRCDYRAPPLTLHPQWPPGRWRPASPPAAARC